MRPPACHARPDAYPGTVQYRVGPASVPGPHQAPALSAPAIPAHAPKADRSTPDACRSSAIAHQVPPMLAGIRLDAPALAAGPDPLVPTDAADFACARPPAPFHGGHRPAH